MPSFEDSVRAVYVSKTEARTLLQAGYWLDCIVATPFGLKYALQGAFVGVSQRKKGKLLQVQECVSCENEQGKLRERQTRLQCTDCSGASPQLLFDNNLLDGLPPAVAAAAETGHVAAGMNKAEWSEMITRLQQTTTRNSSLLICSSHKVVPTMIKLWSLQTLYPLLEQLHRTLPHSKSTMSCLPKLLQSLQQLCSPAGGPEMARSDAASPAAGIYWTLVLNKDCKGSLDVGVDQLRQQQLPLMSPDDFSTVLRLLQAVLKAVQQHVKCFEAAQQCRGTKKQQEPVEQAAVEHITTQRDAHVPHQQPHQQQQSDSVPAVQGTLATPSGRTTSSQSAASPAAAVAVNRQPTDAATAAATAGLKRQSVHGPLGVPDAAGSRSDAEAFAAEQWVTKRYRGVEHVDASTYPLPPCALGLQHPLVKQKQQLGEPQSDTSAQSDGHRHLFAGLCEKEQLVLTPQKTATSSAVSAHWQHQTPATVLCWQWRL